MIERPDWALVLGGGADVWLEIGRLEAMIGGEWPGIVIAVNDVGTLWPHRLDHWATLHPEKLHEVDPDDGLGDWLKKREDNGHPGGFKTWGRRSPKLVENVIQPWGGGSSGFFGVRVAHHIGITRAICCGVPMTETPHYHKDNRDGEDWRHADLHWRSWVRHIHRVEGWVRSMSGRTMDRLGYPDLAWLEAAGGKGQ